jgi:hypothetical protein
MHQVSNNVEARLRRLEDKDEIRELAISYGIYVDGRDAPRLRALFTDDARFRTANGVFDSQGGDNLVALLVGREDVAKASLHVQHGHVIDLDADNPDRATGMVYTHAEVVLHAKKMNVSALRYDDEYHRIDGQWRFAERCIKFFYRVNAANFVEEVTSDTPVQGGETLLAAELPYDI